MIVEIIKNFIMTCVIEGIITMLLYRKWLLLIDNLACNVITNLSLNYILMLVYLYSGMKSYYIVMAVGEILVIIIEAIIYAAIGRINWKKSFVLSIITNLGSFIIGILIYGFL